jgi:hypothetical protein
VAKTVEFLHKSFLFYAGNPKIGHMTTREILKSSGGTVGEYERKIFGEHSN